MNRFIYYAGGLSESVHDRKETHSMLDLLIGIDAARRLTEELLAYDQPGRKPRKPRRGPLWPGKTVSMLLTALWRAL